MTELETLLSQRYSRRDIVSYLGKISLLGALSSCSNPATSSITSSTSLHSDSLLFTPITTGNPTNVVVPDHYRYQRLISWGDPITKQEVFGFNNDFIAYIPLDNSSTHGLLCVNHESVSPKMMFPQQDKLSKDEEYEQVLTEMKAQGHSVIEIKQDGSMWQIEEGSRYNRRFNSLDTVFELTGPVKANPRVKTIEDPSGSRIIGTLANCAGGKTPWGTVLSAEENFHKYFGGDIPKSEERNYERLGIGPNNTHRWSKHFKRFDINQEPNEPNRFGWIVEIDPNDPNSTPKKHSALGRFKHESATCALTKDGRVAVYLGDDEAGEFIYKYISEERYDASMKDPSSLLTKGTLYVAKCYRDGTVNWLPLRAGEGKLVPENGFTSQADILIEARSAASMAGATSMDRPEDIAIHQKDGRVFIALTNNIKRIIPNGPNPRPFNIHGHLLVIAPRNHDHGDTKARWDVILFNRQTPLSNPDNLAFDNAGNLWIATDGMPESRYTHNGLFALSLDTSTYDKPVIRPFLSSVEGAEVTGPEFTPDCKTLFVALQNPGKGSSYLSPSTRWPEYRDDQPPKPSVIAITQEEGLVIGL